MAHTADQILAILDSCCDSFTFPMLDNGYYYLAATRLSLHRSAEDWALVIELFAFSPRAGLPDTCVATFASRLHDRDRPDTCRMREDYDRYLAQHPHDEQRSFSPIDEGHWQDAESGETVARDARELVLRGRARPLPSLGDYRRHAIELEDPGTPQIFELCRYLAAEARDDVLATPTERCCCVRPETTQILQLEEWHHPDVKDVPASTSETFQQLARALATGDTAHYRPTAAPNTHWRHWPEGGTL